jgi:hypothetical protein
VPTIRRASCFNAGGMENLADIRFSIAFLHF